MCYEIFDRIKSGKGLKIIGLEVKEGWRNENEVEHVNVNTSTPYDDYAEYIFEKLPLKSIDEVSSDASFQTFVFDVFLLYN